MRGRLIDITKDLLTGEFQLRLAVRTIPSGVERLREETDLSITMTKWRERRTLTANAYYWVIVTKLSEISGFSNARVHNMLLSRYGVLEQMEGETLTVMIPNTDEAAEDVLEKEIYHLKPTSHVKQGKNGQMFRAYYLMKGSSDMDTKEFSRLLDGAIDEAKACGIDVLPPDEIERMMEDYEKHFAKG